MPLAKLRNDLVVSSAQIDGQTVYNIKDPITGRYFRLRAPEHWLVRQLDGLTAYAGIASEFNNKFGLQISENDVMTFVAKLEELYFLEDGRSEQEISRKSYRRAAEVSLFQKLLFIRLKAFDPSAFLNKLVRYYRPLHNRFWFLFYFLLILCGIILFFANISSFSLSLNSIFSFGSIVAIVVSLFVIVTLHEFAHAVICRYHGGEVQEMGVLLLYFQPCFYSNLSDAWLFPNKAHRLAVTAAGPFFQFVLFALAVIGWRVTVPGTFVNEVCYIIVLVSFITFLFNLNPLIKLDGYYLLSDWLDIPNLRSKSFAYLKNLIQRRLLGWPIESQEIATRERKIFLWYSFLAIIYSTFLLGYVLYLVGSFVFSKLGGFGLALLAVALLYSLNKNLAAIGKGIVQHVIFMKEILKQPAKMAKYLVFLVVFVIGFFFVRFPHRVSGEVSVQPILEFSIKLNELGLLESQYRKGGTNPEKRASFVQMASTDMAVLDLIPKVKDGQQVNQGDTVALLTSNQVSNEIQAARSELERLEGQLALLRAPKKKEEIEEAEAAVDAAQTKVEQLQRDYDRVRGLSEKNMATTAQLETVRSEFLIADFELSNKKARLKLLKSPPRPQEESVIISEIDKQNAHLRFLEEQRAAQVITAPIAGVISAAKPDESLLSVVDVHEVEVLVPVSDFDIDLVELEQSVKLKVRSFPARSFIGRVAHIPKEATEINGKAYFMVSVVAKNPDGALYDGMTGYAKIEIGKKSLFGLASRKIASFIRVEFWSWW
jgi:putative peptide zinc metalloprotease protein